MRNIVTATNVKLATITTVVCAMVYTVCAVSILIVG